MRVIIPPVDSTSGRDTIQIDVTLGTFTVAVIDQFGNQLAMWSITPEKRAEIRAALDYCKDGLR